MMYSKYEHFNILSYALNIRPPKEQVATIKKNCWFLWFYNFILYAILQKVFPNDPFVKMQHKRAGECLEKMDNWKKFEN